jgi:hypothetical protein
LSWLRHGPPRARVGEVHADWTAPAGCFRRFSVVTR